MCATSGADNLFTDIFNKFSDKAPISIIFRATLERTINPEFINNLYDDVSQKQYTRKLIFSTIFELILLPKAYFWIKHQYTIDIKQQHPISPMSYCNR